MSYEMFVVAFQGENKAREVMDELKRLDDRDIIELEEAAVVVKAQNSSLAFEGEEEPNPVEGAVAGANVGAYQGAATGIGVLIGLIDGAIQGIIHPRTVDLEISDDFLMEVSQSLTPGSSAIVAIVEFEKVDKAMQALDKFEGGKILRHTLSRENYAKLSAAVED